MCILVQTHLPLHYANLHMFSKVRFLTVVAHIKAESLYSEILQEQIIALYIVLIGIFGELIYDTNTCSDSLIQSKDIKIT
jgi:hypothetical protein